MNEQQVSRRTLAKGTAWAVPVIATAGAAPLVAASTYTVAVQPYEYQTVFSRTPTSCNTTTNPQKGYIDTMCCKSPVSPTNSDCNQNPSTSQGFWLESKTGAAGTAAINSITVTYTFNHAVSFDSSTYAQGTANTSGGSTWNSPNILGSGWTITSTTSTSITLTYSGSGGIQASTVTNGSGFCTGFFINFHVTDGCYGTGGVTVSTAITMYYSDSTGSNLKWTKNVSTGI